MAATIQQIVKPTRARGLDTSGNNNHAQIYSGRALEFDGVTDYLSVSEINGTTNFDEGSAYSWATWINFSSFTSSTNWFLGKGSSHPNILARSTGRLAIREAGGNAAYYYLSSGNLNVNTWYRLVVTADTSNNLKTYINGVLDNTLSEGDSPYSGSGTFGVGGSNLGTEFTMTRIGGGYTNNAYPLNGMMSDFQIWNTTLTQDDVTYDYLNPEQLVLNRGGTSLTNSNLKLWYPMNDGHRGNQSYVLDASNTGLGDNLVTNGTFDTDTHWHKGSSGGISISDGKLRWDGTQTGWAAAQNNQDGASNTTVSGQTYRAKFDWTRSASTLQFKTGGSHLNIGSGSGTSGSADFTFIADGSYWYFTGDLNMIATVDNVEVYPINAKNNATTVFYGDELVTNSTFETSSSNWTLVYSGGSGSGASIDAANTSSPLDGSKDLKIVNTSAGENAGAVSNGISFIAGKTYQVSYKYKASDTGCKGKIGHVNNSTGGSHIGGSVQQNLDNTTETDHSYTFTSTETETNYVTFIVPDGVTLQVDNVSVKEVGVASGWTDADQQLDIPQTALQSYSQIPYNFTKGGSSSTSHFYTCDASVGTVVNNSFTLSMWLFSHDEDSGTQFLFAVNDRDAGYNTEEGFAIKWLTNGNLQFSYQINDGGDVHSTTGQIFDSNDLGKWFHFAISHNYSNDTTSVYKNGQLITTKDHSTTMDLNIGGGTTQVDVHWGDASAFKGSNLKGAMNEMSVWNTNLNASQIDEIYNNGSPLDCTTHSASSNLTNYWRNNGLAVWQDLAGSNNLTPTNFTETMLITAGVDSSRDSQGFFMNKQRTTNSLNFPTVLGGNSNKEYAVIPTGSGTTPGDNLHFVGRPFSFTCWVKTHYVTGAAQIIFDRGDGTDGYLLKVSGTGIPVFTTEEDNTEISATASGGNGGLTSGVMTNGIWYFIAGTHEGTAFSADQKLYVGTSNITPALITTQANGVGMETSAANLYIGRRFNGGLPYNGEIDDLCFYDNKELTLKEITRNYNAGKRSHR